MFVNDKEPSCDEETQSAKEKTDPCRLKLAFFQGTLPVCGALTYKDTLTSHHSQMHTPEEALPTSPQLHMFPLLPPELRIQIWQHAIEDIADPRLAVIRRTTSATWLQTSDTPAITSGPRVAPRSIEALHQRQATHEQGARHFPLLRCRGQASPIPGSQP